MGTNTHVEKQVKSDYKWKRKEEKSENNNTEHSNQQKSIKKMNKSEVGNTQKWISKIKWKIKKERKSENNKREK